MQNIVDIVKEDHRNPKVADHPDFRSGDTVAVHSKIREGEKSRIQIFQGVVISIRRDRDMEGHFRVRKVSSGVGVERVFPFHSPLLEKIEVVRHGKARRSKLYYLRQRSGKSARIAIDYERK